MFPKIQLPQGQASQNNITLKAMKWLLIVVTIFLFVLTIIGGAALAYPQIYQNRFFPGVKILNQPLSGLDTNQAVDWLQKQADDFLHRDLIYQFRGEVIKVPLILQADDPDVSRKLVDYKVGETVARAYAIGRAGNFIDNAAVQLKVLIFGSQPPIQMELDENDLADALYQNFKRYASPKVDARPKFDQDLNLEIVAGQAGADFDYHSILKKTIQQISNLSNQPITVDLISQPPAVETGEITGQLIQQAKDLVATSSIALLYKDNQWPVSNQIFKDWLIFKKNQRAG